MPIFSTLITSLLSGTALGGFLATGFGQALLGIGINLAVGAIQQALAPKPVSGTVLEVQFGEDTARGVACGLVGTAGQLVYANSYGDGNKYLQHVYVLSDFYATSLERVFINGKVETLGAAVADLGRPVTSGDYANLIWIKFVDGRQTVADAHLVATANPSDRWTADHKLTGLTHAIVTMKFDREKLGSVPQFIFEIKGAPFYDFRKDSTVGGSGAHRWNDVTTWEYTANPVIIAYNYKRGLTVNSDLFAGMEVDAQDIPISRLIAPANLCDEAVGSRLRYVVSAILNLNGDHRDNVDALMRACGGIPVIGLDGMWPIVGSAQSVVATITDDDLVVGQPLEYQRLRPMTELVNSVSGTYANPENAWSQTGYQRAVATAALATDRITRDVSMNFEMVPNAEQAAQLASIYLSENRFEATASLVVRSRFQLLEPGDWINWDSARYGLKTYMVTGVEVASDDDAAGPRSVRLTLQERDGAIYTSVGTVTPPVIINPAEPVYQQELQSFAVSAVNIVGTGSVIQPAIRVTWAAPIDPTVSGAIMEYRVKSGPADAILTRSITNGATVAILSDGVVRNTVYEVRHRIITDPVRAVTPSAWVEVTTNDVGSSVDWEQLSEPVRDWLGGMDTRVAAALQNGAENEWEDVYGKLGTMVQGAKASIEAGDARATIRRETRLLASADEALATDIVALGASIGDKADAAVVTAQGARVTALEGQTTALASYDTTLTSRVDEASAGALFAMQTEASPGGGVVARLSMFARTAIGGVLRRAGLLIDVTASDASVSLVADKIKFLDSLGNAFALFTPGGTVINAARIDNLTAGNFVGDTITANSVVANAVTIAGIQAGTAARFGAMTATTLPSVVGETTVDQVTLDFGRASTTRPATIAAYPSVTLSWTNNNGDARGLILRLKCEDGSGVRTVASRTVSSTNTTSGSVVVDLTRNVHLEQVLTRADGTVRYFITLEKTGPGSSSLAGYSSATSITFNPS